MEGERLPKHFFYGELALSKRLDTNLRNVLRMLVKTTGKILKLVLKTEKKKAENGFGL